jgi:hypothetical protein
VPANSSVAPAATVAVAPAPTVGAPVAMLNLSVPAETVVSPVYVLAPLSVVVPAPVLTIEAPVPLKPPRSTIAPETVVFVARLPKVRVLPPRM